jgi:hypothetical protein
MPTVINKFDLIHNLKEDEDLTKMGKKDLSIRNVRNYAHIKERTKCVESQRKKKHKVLIIGDSHTKKCAAELRQTVDHRYEVMGFRKPGAN